MISSCGVEPKRVIAYKPLLDEALRLSQHKVSIRIVYQRPGLPQANLHYPSGDRNFDKEVERIQHESKAFQQCITVDSADPLYLLYTSGTTGRPKVREGGGGELMKVYQVLTGRFAPFRALCVPMVAMLSPCAGLWIISSGSKKEILSLQQVILDG